MQAYEKHDDDMAKTKTHQPITFGSRQLKSFINWPTGIQTSWSRCTSASMRSTKIKHEKKKKKIFLLGERQSSSKKRWATTATRKKRTTRESARIAFVRCHSRHHRLCEDL